MSIGVSLHPVAVGEGSVHAVHTPTGDGLLLTILFPLPCPKLWGAQESWEVITMNNISAHHGTSIAAWLYGGIQVHLLQRLNTQMLHESPEKLLNNQIPLGARERKPSNISTLPRYTWGNRGCASTLNCSSPCLWPCNEAIALVPLCWLLDRASPAVWGWLWVLCVCVAGRGVVGQSPSEHRLTDAQVHLGLQGIMAYWTVTALPLQSHFHLLMWCTPVAC